jgi:hypothetical protein
VSGSPVGAYFPPVERKLSPLVLTLSAFSYNSDRSWIRTCKAGEDAGAAVWPKLTLNLHVYFNCRRKNSA